LVVRYPAFLPAKKLLAVFNVFSKREKDTPVERSGKFLERDSKYSATTLSFFSRKASNGAMKK